MHVTELRCIESLYNLTSRTKYKSKMINEHLPNILNVLDVNRRPIPIEAVISISIVLSLYLPCSSKVTPATSRYLHKTFLRYYYILIVTR